MVVLSLHVCLDSNIPRSQSKLPTLSMMAPGQTDCSYLHPKKAAIVEH